MSQRTPQNLLRIGQLAQRSGVSAKALRLYEQRGLLKPATHSPAGYRLYGTDALAALMQILLLRRSGFSLAEIGRLLQRQPGAASLLIEQRIAALQAEVQTKAQALETLQMLLQRARSTSSFDIDQLLESIAMTQTFHIDLSPAERTAFRERAEKLGAEGLQAAQTAWPQLIAEVRAAMTAQIGATDASVIALGRRWYELVQLSSGGDTAVNAKLADAYRDQPQAMAAHGMDMEMFRYIGQAMSAAGLQLFPRPA